MKFLRSKAAFIAIALVSVMCLAAAVIAVDVSVFMLKRRDRTIAVQPQQPVSNNVQPVRADELKECVFFFNGQKINVLTTYTYAGEFVFVPIDLILRKIGVGFEYFSPDDTFQFEIAGQKAVFKLGSNEFTFGDSIFDMHCSPVAAKNSILVPIEAFSHIPGFETDVYGESETAFINYYPDYMKKAENVRVLRLVNGLGGIYDMEGNELYWSAPGEREGIDSISRDAEGIKYLLKAGESSYIIESRGNGYPASVNVSPEAGWSADGKYLYWIDYEKKLSYIYDIKTALTKKLGDYYFRIERDNVQKSVQPEYAQNSVLYDYKKASLYRRAVFTNAMHEGKYAFIERKGKTVLQGYVAYSPDRQRVLYYKNGEGYYVSVVDGTRHIFLGEYVSAVWVNNDKITLSDNRGVYLFDISDKMKLNVEKLWRKVGQAPNGDVLFTVGNLLMCEANGEEKPVLQLPWACDSVLRLSEEGLYIAVSSEEDSVYYINKDKLTNICAASELLIPGGLLGEKGAEEAISRAKGGKRTAVLVNRGGFLGLNIIEEASSDITEITLNYRTDSGEAAGRISSKWLSDTRLLIYLKDRAWLVDTENDVKIYRWDEKKQSTIEGAWVLF
ncbi:hypothetical protein DFR58_12622 [Anaerobacterium chartisolvens]|uniref:Copper amine oxidase-like N-terminal domain-containing protein n=1 Tax=Anaerobacterium chartisolvens TaxID=1297424 RepID=A0A369APF0_9FIRM|nr:stalk domain-containing protein [Anaerobacterium chartisolvens]RCX11249.1 hypothetical protein DFR58_12622 [Anaerobacterium chartisolvens]